MNLEHLRGRAREAVLWTPEERIHFVNTDRWIGYGAATQVITEVKDLIEFPRNLRMPCRAIVGEPRNGKTMLLQECAKRYSSREDTSDGECHLPLLVFETPPEPDEARLYSAILTALRVAHREDSSPERLLPKVIEKVFDLGIRVLMADEFHNMLNGPAKNQRQFLAALKSLLNILRVAFVATGIQDIVMALATDGQFQTRFEKIALPTWSLNTESRQLLASLETTLPLAQPSGLANSVELAQAVILGGRGTIGDITSLVRKAAIAAIRKGKEKIERDEIEQALALMHARRVMA